MKQQLIGLVVLSLACSAPQGADGAPGGEGAQGPPGNPGAAGAEGEAGAPGVDAVSPTGSIIAFAGLASKVPVGWALCDGSAVSRTDPKYAALFAVVGTLHGSGDNVTTFNLPDYRGRFLRGIDNGVGRDPDVASRTASTGGGATGDTVGSVEGEATALPTTPFTTDTQGSHTHTAQSYLGNGVMVYDIGNPVQNGNLGGGGQSFDYLVLNYAGAHAHTVNAGGDHESRPINAAVNYIIKL